MHGLAIPAPTQTAVLAVDGKIRGQCASNQVERFTPRRSQGPRHGGAAAAKHLEVSRRVATWHEMGMYPGEVPTILSNRATDSLRSKCDLKAYLVPGTEQWRLCGLRRRSLIQSPIVYAYEACYLSPAVGCIGQGNPKCLK